MTSTFAPPPRPTTRPETHYEAAVRLYRLAVRPCVQRYIPHMPTGKQAAFLAYDGREALYGGAGGGGKTDALLMAALQYVCVPGYAAVLFRQSYPQLSRPGQFIDRAEEWLTGTDARANRSERRWTFPSGAILQFGYVERDADRYGWAGPELQFAGWDELTNWATPAVYRFISFSRARRPSMQRTDLEACPDCGMTLADVPLRARAGTNPGGPGHDWVMETFVQPWTDAKEAQTLGRVKLARPFFPARLIDNPHIDREEYHAGLAELDPVDRARIEDGDWTVREKGGMFERQWFPIVDDYPRDAMLVRYWDSAATEPHAANRDPDWTVGTLMAMKDGQFWIVDVDRFRESDLNVERRLFQRAQLDGVRVPIWFEQEGGSSGKILAAHYQRRVFVGFNAKGDPPSGSKADRARPLASAAEAGNVFLVRGEWNAEWLAEVEAFPQKGWHDDQVDSASGAHSKLAAQMRRRASVAVPGSLGVPGVPVPPRP